MVRRCSKNREATNEDSKLRAGGAEDAGAEEDAGEDAEEDSRKAATRTR